MLRNIYEVLLHNGLISFLLRCRLVSISGRGKIVYFIKRIASNFFFCSYNTRSSFKNLLPVFHFLLIAVFCIRLGKCYLTSVTFCTKLRLGIYRHTRSSFFYLLILVYYILWCSS